jgi:hypothetical protein
LEVYLVEQAPLKVDFFVLSTTLSKILTMARVLLHCKIANVLWYSIFGVFST